MLSGHEGTDYVLGGYQTEGTPVLATARGTAKSCSYSSTAGYSVLIDHDGGHRTRYLHLYQYGLPAAGGQVVARG